MKTINKPILRSLVILWSHERAELCNKYLFNTISATKYSIVNKGGNPIDITVADYDGSDSYGIHMGDGIVYWANAVFNSKYIAWPENITQLQKTLITDQLEKTFLIIK